MKGLALLLLLTLSSSAFGGETLMNPTESSRRRWEHYFGSVPKLPDPHGTIASLIKPENPRCTREIEKMFAWVDDYGFAAFKSKSGKADRIYSKIDGRLRKLLKSQDPCFLEAARAYAVASIMLLDYYDFDLGMAAAYTEEDVRMSTSIALNLLAITLFNRGLIEPITEEFRGKQKEPLWRDRIRSGDGYQIVGAYKCSESRIFIDPFQRPINLGSSLLHELGHLFRDKFHSLKGVDWRSYLLEDETLSVLQAVFFQRRLLDSLLPLRKRGFGPFSSWEQFEAYRIDHDISLFRRNGPLERLWQSLGQNPSTLYLRDFLRSAFLRGSAHSEVRRGMRQSTQEIWEIVGRAYFERFPELPVLESLKSDRDPLSQWLVDHEVRLVSYEGGKYPAEARDWWARFHWVGIPLPPDGRMPVFRFTQYFDALDELEKKLGSISPGCSQFMEKLQEGELDDYLGRKLGEIPGQEGARPGQEGARPGQDGARPGQDGARPGQDGARPGGWIRPCVNFKEEL